MKQIKRSRRRTMLGTLGGSGDRGRRALVGAPGAAASFEFNEAEVSLNHSAGAPSRQAGAHSNLRFRVTCRSAAGASSPTSARDVSLYLPPGLVGNAAKLPTCTFAELQNNTRLLRLPGRSPGGDGRNRPQLLWRQLRRLQHGPRARHPGPLRPQLRRRDRGDQHLGGNGERCRCERLPGQLGLAGDLAVAAVPGRQPDPLGRARRPFPRHRTGSAEHGGDPRHPNPQAPRPRVPFLSNPTSCDGTPGVFTARGDSWEQPGVFDTRFLGKDPNGNAFTFTGCEQVPFDRKCRRS